jgi:Na+/phosphate symporter
MTEKPFQINPFQVSSPQVDREVRRLEELRGVQVSESSTLQDGLISLLNKVIDMTDILSVCTVTGGGSGMERCEQLYGELLGEEKTLTKYLVSSGVGVHAMKGVIRFPFRLKRIGDLLDIILRCCRYRVQGEIPLSDKAKLELEQIFSILRGMMIHLREGFVSPQYDRLTALSRRSKTLSQILEYFRSEHWERVEAGLCAPEASSTYREILDSVKWINEYLEKMGLDLLTLWEPASEGSVGRTPGKLREEGTRREVEATGGTARGLGEQ